MTVKNFKSLENVTLEFSSDLVILIGKNNSGKSNFLDVINFLLEGGKRSILDALDIRGKFENIVFGKDVSREIEIKLRFSLFENSRKKLIEKCIPRKRQALLGDLLNTKFLQEIEYLLILGLERRYELLGISNLDGRHLPVFEWEGDFRNSNLVRLDMKQALKRWEKGRNLTHELKETGGGANDKFFNLGGKYTPQPPEEAIYSHFYSTISNNMKWVSPIRKSSVRVDISGSHSLGPESQNLADVLHTYYTNKPELYREIRKGVNKMIPELNEILPPTEGKSTTVGIKEKGFSPDVMFPLENISSGIKNVLAIITHIAGLKKGGLICVEEPEICVHPSIQRDLMYFFEEQSTKKMIILSTHSPILPSVTDLRNVRLISKSASGATMIEEITEENLPKLLRELGVRASDIFNDDIIIFVEGIEDEKIFNVFLEKLKKARKLKKIRGVKIGFINTEGWPNMEYYANIRVLESKGFSIPSFIIFDGDTERKEKYSKIKRQLIDRVKIPEERIFTLERNSIENYILSPRAIRKAVPTVLMSQKDIASFLQQKSTTKNKKKALNQLLKKNGLRYNKKTAEAIAKEMSVSEIDEEIQKMFQKILDTQS